VNQVTKVGIIAKNIRQNFAKRRWKETLVKASDGAMNFVLGGRAPRAAYRLSEEPELIGMLA